MIGRELVSNVLGVAAGQQQGGRHVAARHALRQPDVGHAVVVCLADVDQEQGAAAPRVARQPLAQLLHADSGDVCECKNQNRNRRKHKNVSAAQIK